MPVRPDEEVGSPVGAKTGDPGVGAWVEYLRDLGIYDLYQRETPGIQVSAAMRERLLSGPTKKLVETKPPGSQTSSPRAVLLPGQTAARSQATVAEQRRGSEVRQKQAVPPSGPALSPPARLAVTSGEPVRSYFTLEEDAAPTLPPELAAPMPRPNPLETLLPQPAVIPAGLRAEALERLRAHIGDCTRCPLAYAGRHTIVFGEGDPNAELMFVGEGPGADEDATGQPFVGKAGQLLNNMIGAMGLAREQVYIANIVKCRPPGNRAPEFVEATTCSQFLLQQIDIVRPKVLVALGATAATYVLGVRQSLASLRGQWFASRGAKVAVTYHPAFLLRDPRQKAEAWKDLQRVMAELGLRPATKG